MDKSKLWLTVLVVAVSIGIGICGTASDECGHYKQVKKGDDGHIKSPNHPNNYPNKYRCIWLYKAPKNWKFSVTIPSMDGEEDGEGGCNDYLELRSGSATEDLLYYDCVNSTSVTVESDSRWLWVKFQSNKDSSNTGFRLEWELVRDSGNGDDSSPLKTCEPVSVACANKECVSAAYVCDGYHDCGCIGESCDEANCDGLGLNGPTLIGLGVTLGVIIFTPVFLGIGLLDIWLKSRAEGKQKKREEEAKRREKLKRLGRPATSGQPGATAPGSPAVARKK